MKKILFALLACVALLSACEPKEILVTKITLHKYEGSMVEGQERLIKAIVSPEAATRPEITWTSSDPSVATVKAGQTKNSIAQGTITAVAPGIATITLAATDGSGVTAAYELTVTEKMIPVTRIQLTKESAKLKIGESVQLEAVVSPDNATYPDVKWTSSKTDVATVDATGKVTAVGEGTAEISAVATDGSNVRCDKPCTITVREPKEQPMFVKFSDMLIRVGAGIDEPVWYGTVDDYANKEDVDLEVLTNCKSSNTSVATILVGKYIDKDGKEQEGVLISGVNPGKAVITIGDSDGNSVEVPVEVVPASDIPEDYNYGIQLFNTRSTDNWGGAHGEVSLGPGYVDGTQCLWVKNFGRAEGPAKKAYTLFECKLPRRTYVDISEVQNPALYIRFYVNDPALLMLDGANTQIEITSSGDMDEDEYSWNGGNSFTNWPGGSLEAKMELKAGWNNIVLPLSYAQTQTPSFNPKKVNYFRFYNNPYSDDLTGKGVEVAIDLIRIVDWTEFDTCDNFDHWYDSGTANNRPCYRFEESFDGHTGVFLSKNDLISKAISNFRLKEWPGRIYSMPVNMWSGTPEQPGNAQLTWWIWVDDADFFNKCTLSVEVSSDNENDKNSWIWTHEPGQAALHNGWNQLTEDFAIAHHAQTALLSDRKINYFRIFFTPGAGAKPSIHTYKIDEIRVQKK